MYLELTVEKMTKYMISNKKTGYNYYLYFLRISHIYAMYFGYVYPSTFLSNPRYPLFNRSLTSLLFFF